MTATTHLPIQNPPKLLALLGCCICPAWSLIVDSNSPTASINPNNQYGNAYSSSFHKAINGLSDTPVDEMLSLPVSDENKYYFRLGFNKGVLGVDAIGNKSKGTYESGIVETKKFNKNQTGLEIAYGYKLKEWRMEGELIFNRSLKYNPDSIFKNISPSPSLLSTVKISTLMLHFYYDFEGIQFIQPYLAAGLGSSYITTHSEVFLNNTSQESRNLRKLEFAFGAKAGLRYRLFSNVDLDLNLKNLRPGKVFWRTSDQNSLQGQSYTTNYGLSFIFIM
ncbi:MAG: opacity family porin [Gammaproteobacteria bacterium]